MYYTTSQASRLLGVSRQAVLRYCTAGTLPAHQLPSGHWRVLAKAVHERVSSESPAEQPRTSGSSRREAVTAR